MQSADYDPFVRTRQLDKAAERTNKYGPDGEAQGVFLVNPPHTQRGSTPVAKS